MFLLFSFKSIFYENDSFIIIDTPAMNFLQTSFYRNKCSFIEMERVWSKSWQSSHTRGWKIRFILWKVIVTTNLYSFKSLVLLMHIPSETSIHCNTTFIHTRIIVGNNNNKKQRLDKV